MLLLMGKSSALPVEMCSRKNRKRSIESFASKSSLTGARMCDFCSILTIIITSYNICYVNYMN